MSHMPSMGTGVTVTTVGTVVPARIVTYVATGAEGVDFMVPIGATLANDEYDVGFFGAAGAVTVPAVWDFPNALAGDRTASAFRVLVPDVLVAGDVFKFQVTATAITTVTTIEPDDSCACSGGGTFFSYTATGSEGASFTVTLPDEIDDDYAVIVTCGEVAYQLTFNTTNHTSTGFTLVCSSAPAVDDVIFFTIGEVSA